MIDRSTKKETCFPSWVKRNPEYLTAFLPGLIDTEGSVYRVEKGKRRLRIEIKMRDKRLLEDLSEALQSLNLLPRIYRERNRVMLARQDEVDHYFNEMCSHNLKHVKRYLSLREDQSLNAPVV